MAEPFQHQVMVTTIVMEVVREASSLVQLDAAGRFRSVSPNTVVITPVSTSFLGKEGFKAGVWGYVAASVTDLYEEVILINRWSDIEISFGRDSSVVFVPSCGYACDGQASPGEVKAMYIHDVERPDRIAPGPPAAAINNPFMQSGTVTPSTSTPINCGSASPQSVFESVDAASSSRCEPYSQPKGKGSCSTSSGKSTWCSARTPGRIIIIIASSSM